MLLFWPCAWGLTLVYDFNDDLNVYKDKTTNYFWKHALIGDYIGSYYEGPIYWFNNKCLKNYIKNSENNNYLNFTNSCHCEDKIFKHFIMKEAYIFKNINENILKNQFNYKKIVSDINLKDLYNNIHNEKNNNILNNKFNLYQIDYDLKQCKTFKTPIDDSSIILLAIMKNEEYIIEYFLNYYKKKGITHFILIDNNSTDNSKKYIINSNFNILLYSTLQKYNFSNYGSYIINILLNLHCKDKWCLVVDSDEFINCNLLELKEKMIIYGNNVSRFVLTDLYSEEKNIIDFNNNSINQTKCYFDKYIKFVELDYPGKIINISGIKNRCLNKVSFFKYNFYKYKIHLSEGYHYLLNNENEHISLFEKTSKINFYNNTEILLHYKFILRNYQYFCERFKNNVDWYNSIEYKYYIDNYKYINDLSNNKILLTEINNFYLKFNNLV